MQLPTDRKYVSTHEWALVDGDVVLVGITDFAQEQLGDLVFVGDFQTEVHLQAGAIAGVVESVKAASDIYAPVSGTVIAFNEQLSDSPETLNDLPYDSWIFKLKPDDMAAVEQLLSAEQYQQENS